MTVSGHNNLPDTTSLCDVKEKVIELDLVFVKYRIQMKRRHVRSTVFENVLRIGLLRNTGLLLITDWKSDLETIECAEL